MSLEILESEGSHDAIRDDQRYEDHVGKEAGAQFPRETEQRTAPTGCDVLSFLQHLV
jgi:hypothetical protein